MARNTTSAATERSRSAAMMRGEDADRATWLLCRAGTQLCAMPIAPIIEIMRVLPIEAVAGAPDYVRGLSIIRGSPVPVVDIGRLVGERAAQAQRLIAIKARARTIALAADEVMGIRTIDGAASSQLPPLLRDACETVAAIGTLDAELLLFLRLTRIVPEDVLARLDAAGAVL